MKFPWKNALWVPVITFGLGGCASNEGSNAVRGIASSLVAGNAFDRATLAIRRNDMAGAERAGNQMRRAADVGANPQLMGALATNLTAEAISLSVQVLGARGEEKNSLEESSFVKYRAALAFAPQKFPEKSLDARTLNALGYFLADKGSTRTDFERAAVLTLAAYKTWDLSGRFTDSNELGRAISPQDSYAWALFKLGRYEEARVQQEKVWDLARGMDAEELTGDIPFHLGEIYRALGQYIKARSAYEAALGLKLTEETRILVEGGLKLLDQARV